MSFAKESIHSYDLSKSEELLHQFSEMQYHLKNVDSCIKEAIHHLKKYKYHESIAKVSLSIAGEAC